MPTRQLGVCPTRALQLRSARLHGAPNRLCVARRPGSAEPPSALRPGEKTQRRWLGLKRDPPQDHEEDRREETAPAPGSCSDGAQGSGPSTVSVGKRHLGWVKTRVGCGKGNRTSAPSPGSTPRGREAGWGRGRSDPQPRGSRGPGPVFPAPNPRRVASAFRNVLSVVGTAKERGPRQVAGSSDTFLAEA